MTKAKWQLPQGWEWACFDDVAEVASNLVDPADYPDYAHIAPNHIESRTGRLLDYTTVAMDRVTSPKHLFRCGQILYSKIRPYLAKAAIVDFEGLCSADMYPVTTDLDSRYLHRWLISPMFTALTSQNQGRTVLPKINQNALGKLGIPVAPLNEQRRIANKLEALQRRTRRARAALDAIPPLLEKFRQSVLAAAFRGDLTADWRAQNPNLEPASVLLERIREERRRRWEEAELAQGKALYARGKRFSEPATLDADIPIALPRTWAWARLDSLAFIKGGLTKGKRRKPADKLISVPYLRVANVQRGFLELGEVLSIEATAEEIDALKLQPGDILFNEGGDRDKLGRGWIWEGQIPTCIHQNHVFRARLVTEEIPPELVSQYANTHGQSYFMAEGKQTTNLASISLSKLSGLPVPVIPKSEAQVLLNRLRLKLSSADIVMKIHSDMMPDLDLLDQSVLAKAFRGELVPQDPNDEPASKLLERIRAAKQQVQPARRGRRRAKGRKPEPKKAPKAEPPRAEPTQKAVPKPEPPVPDDTDLRDRVHRVLLGRGPLDRDAAIREVASAMRDAGALDFQRLRRDGPLYQALDQALDSALAANLLDGPNPGEVRAVVRNARDYTPDDWRLALLSCLGDEPAEREDAIEAAAIWAAENMGLEFQRLRRDGVIVRGLKSALRTAIRRGEVERLGPSRVRKSRSEPGPSSEES